jgi:hypothetical protein
MMLSEMLNSIRTTMNFEGNMTGNDSAHAPAQALKTNKILADLE